MANNNVLIELNSLWKPNFLEGYSALANTHGGTLTFGYEIKNGNTVLVGVKYIEELYNEIESMLNDPSLINRNILSQEDFSIQKDTGKSLLILQVREAKPSEKPILWKGRAFVRGESGNQVCEKNMVESMSQSADGFAWDTKTASKSEVNELLTPSFKNYRKRFHSLHNQWVLEKDLSFLVKIRAAKEENGVIRPTMAGLLMFGSDESITKEFPYFSLLLKILQKNYLGLNQFASGDSSFDGGLYSYFEFVLQAAKSLFPSYIEEKNRKIFEESLLNALENMDFGSREPFITILSQDQYEIVNPGLMGYGAANHQNCPRHPLIEKYFFLIGIGTLHGMNYLNSALSTRKLPLPNYQELTETMSTRTRISFKENSLMEERKEKKEISKEAKRFAELLRGDFKEEVAIALGDFYVKNKGEIFGRTEILEATGVSPATATSIVKKLAETKKIKAVKGKGKGKYQFR